MSLKDDLIQVTPDSTGKRVRNLSGPVTLADETRPTVYTQVVTLVDQDGDPVVPFDHKWQSDVLEELRAIRRLLAANAGQFTP